MSLAASALLTLVVGCGQIFGVDFDGHAASGDPGGGPDGTYGGVPGPGDINPVPDTPPSPGTEGGPDAGPDSRLPDAHGDGDAPDPPTGPILPLVVGNSWTYSVVEVGSMPECPTGSHDWIVIDKVLHDGKLAFAIQPFCTGMPTAYWSQSGDVNARDDLGTWDTFTDVPVAAGHRFTNVFSTYEWHDIGTYAVPAGTFAGCFDLVDVAGPSHSVFCRGVGVVYQVLRTAAGDGYDATLTKKNF
jgi:hypothetical protein